MTVTMMKYNTFHQQKSMRKSSRIGMDKTYNSLYILSSAIPQALLSEARAGPLTDYCIDLQLTDLDLNKTIFDIA